METTAFAYIIALVLIEVYCIERMIEIVKDKLTARSEARREAMRTEAFKAKREAYELRRSREALWNYYVRRSIK